MGLGTKVPKWDPWAKPGRVSGDSGGSSPGPGGHAPRWRPDNFFRHYINIITKPTAYDGPREY